MMLVKINRLVSWAILLLSVFFVFSINAAASDKPVWITPELESVKVLHDGETVEISRIQDTENMVDFDFALTSRECPPFCIQPMTVSTGVETIGELELLSYLRRMSTGDTSILVIDSREESWLSKGMIPGAISIPWKKMHFGHAKAKEVSELLEFQLGASFVDGFWNFANAKTLVFYCNGIWCGQSPTNIKSLVEIGYPPDKLKWYRGGMQSWIGLGLTIVKPGKN